MLALLLFTVVRITIRRKTLAIIIVCIGESVRRRAAY